MESNRDNEVNGENEVSRDNKVNRDNEVEELLGSYRFNKNKPILTLFDFYRGKRGKLFLSLIFFILKNSPVWVIPIVTANIIDIAGNPSKHGLSSLWINLIIAVAIIAQNVPTHMLHVKYLSEPVRYVEAELRSSLVKKLQMLSISYHKELQSGRLQSKILRDVEAIQYLSMQISATILPVIFNVSVALIVTINRSITVFLFFLSSLPIALLFTSLFRKNIRKTNVQFRMEIEEMSAKVAEMVEMIPVTRAHGLEYVEIKKMDNQLNEVREKGYQLDLITSFFGASSWVVFQIFQILCLGFTGYQAYKGKISIGEVVLYQGYFASILNQISNIISTYPVLVKGIESVNSVGEILHANDIEDNRGKKKLKKVNGDFSFQDVEFSYQTGMEAVLKDFNLEVKKGECIAFVGESGAGKTTILNLVIGFNKPTKGKLVLDHMNMSEIDLRSYRKFIAVVPQNTILFSGTIRDNITYGLNSVSEVKLQEIVEGANMKEFIDKLPEGINTLVGEHGGNLSGGQRQRIAIARALIRNPQIIILDEPTSALDNISELQVQKAMNNLIKGRTTFIVAHRLSTIRDADRIAVMSHGTCVECGTYDELVAKQGEFYNLNKLQL